MLRIIYPIACGIDVHKKFIVACIASTNKGVTSYKSSRFSTFTKGLRELSEWLHSNSCKDVCMESTGKYWIPVFNILEATCKITLAHPKYAKAIQFLRKKIALNFTLLFLKVINWMASLLRAFLLYRDVRECFRLITPIITFLTSIFFCHNTTGILHSMRTIFIYLDHHHHYFNGIFTRSALFIFAAIFSLHGLRPPALIIFLCYVASTITLVARHYQSLLHPSQSAQLRPSLTTSIFQF